jgi:hypothetical protein
MRLTREALIAANRALVGPIGLPDGALLAAGPTGLKMMLANSGRYPATNIIGKSGFAFIQEALKEDPVPSPAGQTLSIAVLFAGAKIATDLGAGDKPFTDEEIGEVKEAKRFLYYYGIFSYEDGFGSNRETRCCFYYNRRTRSWDWAHVGNRVT